MSKPVLKSEWEVMQEQLKTEKGVLKVLEKHYSEALKAVDTRIAEMMGRNDADLPHVIRRIEYQKMVKSQVQAALDSLHAKEYETISTYLQDTYTDAFVGTMYTLHHQDMPVIVPIDQNAVVKAVTIDSKVKGDLYTALGVDVTKLKKTIASEITRGIASGLLYDDITRNIANTSSIPLKRAKTITRTEAGRVQEQATFDAANKALAAGADVVKQWSAIRDGKTRDTHRTLDGQVREVNEPFTVDGHKAMHPHGFGIAAEDVNCRCTMLTRARAALDADELKLLQERAAAHELLVKDKKGFEDAKAKDFADFKKKYLKAAQTVENTGKSGIIEADKSATLQAPISQAYVDALNSGGKVSTIGNVDCAVLEKDYGFNDGTSGGIKKTVKATVYTTPDGTQFVYPKSYNKKKQTLSPDDAIATWYRVPENIRQKIQKVVEIVDYYNPQDAVWRKRYKNFTHSYATGGNKITLWRSSYHDLSYLAETYCHEGGHYIDFTLPGTSRTNRYCMQSEWQNAMANDLKTSGKKSCSKYGENSPVEDFAESVEHYTFNAARFTALFPERSKLLANILK